METRPLVSWIRTRCRRGSGAPIAASVAVIGVFLAWCHPAEAATVRVSVSVNPRTITEVDTFQIHIRVTGTDGNVEWPDLGQDGFTIVGGPSISQSMRNFNGRISRDVSARFHAQPTKAGTLTIPPVSVKFNGKSYKSQSGARVVVQPVKKNDDVFLRLESAPAAVYPDQWFKVRLKIYARPSTGQYKNQPPFLPKGHRHPWPGLSIPWLQGEKGLETTDTRAFLQALNPSRDNVGFPINNITSGGFINSGVLRFPFKRSHENRKASDGKQHRYFVFTLERQFRGVEPGSYQFAPVVARGKVFASRGARNTRGQWTDMTAKSNSIVVNVKPVPREERPESYSGAIGQFQIAATIKPKTAWVGQPMTLHVDVQGTGKLGPIAPIDIRSQGKFAELFRIHDAETGEVSKDGRSKRFAYTLRPTTANIDAIPAIEFSFFDPTTERFRVVKTTPLPVTVEEGEVVDSTDIQSFSDGSLVNRRRQLQAVEDAIWPVYNKPDALIAQKPIARVSLWQLVLLAGPPLLYFALLLTTARRRRLSADPSILRARGAARKAREALSLARAAAEAGNAAEAYQEISRAVSSFIADRLNRPSAGMTPMDVMESLEQHKVPEDLRNATTTLLEKCEQARYGAPDSADNLVEDVKHALELVTKLEGCLR